MDQPHPITEEELLMDVSFHNWVKRRNQADIQFWEEWVARHPDQRTVIYHAKDLILSLTAEGNTTPVPQVEIHQAWNQLQKVLTRRQQLKTPTKSSGKISRFRKGYVVAAILIVLCISSIIGWQYTIESKKINYATAFGETKVIVLPDGSQVTLNGNTRLSYNKEWAAQENREVWLCGEAYFHVVRFEHKGNLKFTVHTDKLDVEVLGTQFNVSDRKYSTQVVLNEGEIKINPGRKVKAAPMMMKPGELLEYSSTQETFTKKTVNPQMYSSWKNKMMVFEETTMQSIAARIESTYGYRIQFGDSALARRKLTGTIPSDNIEILLLTLSKLFNLEIQKQEDQLYIKPANQ